MSALDDTDRARSALAACNPSCGREEWWRVAMAAKAAGLTFDEFGDWSASGDGYRQADARALWKSIKDGRIGPGTLFHIARGYGWTPDDKLPQRPVRLPEVTRTPDADQIAQAQRKRARAAGVWRASLPIAPGTPAAEYLLGRGCMLPPADGDLRWLPRLQGHGCDGPALVGRVSDPLDATRFLGVHRTWLELDGDRWRRKVRAFLGPVGGGTIRLWPDDCVTLSLAIAEGIENALAGAHLHAPAWACLAAGNLAKFPVLAGVECLTVFADADATGTGQGAAADVAERWLESGCEVAVILPDELGRDIADEVSAWA